ncbi:hypothetical protein [Cronobacter dublinensis]|uniref:hypothetical protein n=1 Tax=Cronobacter dublinensis TaxID=413497 RepID=UPI00131A2265|nr:hypothetical protein [Cronobacter dublinensis]
MLELVVLLIILFAFGFSDILRFAVVAVLIYNRTGKQIFCRMLMMRVNSYYDVICHILSPLAAPRRASGAKTPESRARRAAGGLRGMHQSRKQAKKGARP